MIEVRRVTHPTFIQLGSLLEMAGKHSAETGFGDLDPEWYLEAIKSDRYLLIVAFDGEEPVGYCGWHVQRIANRRGVVHGIMDVVYLEPRYRGGFGSLKLVRKSLEELKQAGVTRAVGGGPAINASLDRLLEYVGFGNPETFRSKEL